VAGTAPHAEDLQSPLRVAKPPLASVGAAPQPDWGHVGAASLREVLGQCTHEGGIAAGTVPHAEASPRERLQRLELCDEDWDPGAPAGELHWPAGQRGPGARDDRDISPLVYRRPPQAHRPGGPAPTAQNLGGTWAQSSTCQAVQAWIRHHAPARARSPAERPDDQQVALQPLHFERCDDISPIKVRKAAHLEGRC